MITENKLRKKMDMEIIINEDDHKVLLFNFFMWFRENGEKYVNISIEKMIEIYLKTID